MFSVVVRDFFRAFCWVLLPSGMAISMVPASQRLLREDPFSFLAGMMVMISIIMIAKAYRRFFEMKRALDRFGSREKAGKELEKLAARLQLLFAKEIALKQQLLSRQEASLRRDVSAEPDKQAGRDLKDTQDTIRFAKREFWTTADLAFSTCMIFNLPESWKDCLPMNDT